MGANACAAMRAEATNLMKVNLPINLMLVCCSGLICLSFALQTNTMNISKSSRWDADMRCHVPYDKHNVLSTEMTGGEMWARAGEFSIPCHHLTTLSGLGILPPPFSTSTRWPLSDPLLLMCKNPTAHNHPESDWYCFQVAARFPEACLSLNEVRYAFEFSPPHICPFTTSINHLLLSTKLAVCTGDGSHFDKHYDNA
jgi:hypothetical protein